MSGIFEGRIDNQKIRDRLLSYPYPSSYRPTEKLIDEIIGEFWFRDYYNSLIALPRFFDYLQEFLVIMCPTTFKRADFYRFFFHKIIGAYVEGIEIDLWLISFRKIALIFEKIQNDTMPLTQYEHIRRKDLLIDNEMFSPEWLVNNQLATIEDAKEGKNIKWIHHTLTEYLTAEYILISPKPLQLALEYLILRKDGFEALKPSWYGVLRFLLDSKITKDLAKVLITFLSKHYDMVDEDISDLLTHINPSILVSLKEKLFNLIYTAYFKNQLWIPVWTRHALGKFCSKKQYDNLKKDLKKTKDETQTFVHRGNAVAIVGGMIEDKNSIITSSEKKLWREKCIEYANDPNENGVLQRNSLDLLENFKGEADIIGQVAEKTFTHPSSLVREAFITFCYTIVPNSPITIKYLVEGIKKGITIYGRYGLYKIQTKQAFLTLFEYFITDKAFLEKFLHSENIFSVDRGKGDKTLIQHIEDVVDAEVVDKLKPVVKAINSVMHDYYTDRSPFLKHIIRIIRDKDPAYLFQLIEGIASSNQADMDRELFNHESLLSYLLTQKNLKKCYTLLKKKKISTKWDRRFSGMVYHANMYNGEVGKRVYKEAVRLKLVEELKDTKESQQYEEQGRERVMKVFRSNLGTDKDKIYMINLFSHFYQNYIEIQSKWTAAEKERFFRLTITDSLDKIEPKNFTVKIKDKPSENREFTWTQQASYFGDLIKSLNIIAPEKLGVYRQKIIDFIPYAYSDDWQIILDSVKSINDTELNFVNKVYADTKDDRRYLETSSYIYLMKEFKKRNPLLSTPAVILESFIGDPYIRDFDYVSALEAVELFLDSNDKTMLQRLKELFVRYEKTDKQNLVASINAILIAKYQDATAIQWRLKRIKRKIAFRRSNSGIVHSVGPEEEEIDGLGFAKPIIELQNTKYIPQILSLLKYSFSILEADKEKKYVEYVNYLWRIVIAYFDKLKYLNSFSPLIKLETLINSINNRSKLGWFISKLLDLKKGYINYFGGINNNGI